jgi:hypothetical protein
MSSKVTVDFVANTNDAQNNMKGFAGSFTEIQSKLNLAKEALDVVGDVFKQTVGSVLEYDDKIKKLSLDLGVSTEEASRMNGVAEKFGVSTEQLTTALDMMVKRGTAPSIATLADLSAKFNSIKDPVERAALMSDKLGKNWTVLNEVLEKGPDAINGAAAALDKSLIVTKEQADQAERLGIAWNTLNLKVEAFKASIFGNAIPALATLLTMYDDTNAAIVEHGNDVIQTSDTYADYYTEMQRAAQAAGMHFDKLGNLCDQTFKIRKENVLLTQSEYEAVKATYAAKAAQDGLSNAQQAGKITQNQFTGAGVRANDMLHEGKAALDAEALAAQNLASATDAAKTAQENLDAAQKSWKEGTAGDVKQALDDAHLPADQYALALGAIDKAYGTNYVERDRMTKDIKDATDNFKQYKDIDSYTVAIGGLTSSFMPFASSIQEANTQLDNANAKLDALDGKHVNAFLDLHVSEIIGGAPYDPNKVGLDPIGGGAANGADFTVPPGYPNDSFPMRVQSGEHVTVTPAGESGGGGININGPITIMTNDPQDLMNKLGQIARSARKSGKGYAGVG